MKKINKKLLITIIISLLCFGFTMGCGGNGGFELKNYLQGQMPKNDDKVATIKTSMGDIKVMFFPEYAPKAVENFISLSEDGYYDGLIFHRVIPDFMIQGGSPNGDGIGGESKWGGNFEDEFSGMLHNFRGALSMANSGANTNSSQFFIVQKDSCSASEISQSVAKGSDINDDAASVYKEKGGTPWLDGHHTVFGQVFGGMDVVDAIVNVKADSGNKPLEDVVINSIEISEYQG